MAACGVDSAGASANRAQFAGRALKLGGREQIRVEGGERLGLPAAAGRQSTWSNGWGALIFPSSSGSVGAGAMLAAPPRNFVTVSRIFSAAA